MRFRAKTEGGSQKANQRMGESSEIGGMGFHFEFWVELPRQMQPVRGIAEKWCEDATLTRHSEWTSDDRVKTRLRCCGGERDVLEGIPVSR